MNKKHTTIELYVSEAVRKKREKKGLSQKELSIAIGLDESFVGLAESQNNKAKFNLNHLNELAKFFKCSISDFLPSTCVEENCIKEYKEIKKQRKIERERLKNQKK